jgi:hypothetical protein
MNTLLPMRVSKHTQEICFDTLPFSSHKRECHPVGRPFLPVYSAAQDLVSWHTW